MQATNRTGERLYSLQILRGLAAVAVLLFHVERYTKIIGGVNASLFNHIPLIFGQGAFWFFEISGFIMAYLIDRNMNKNFLLQRVVRIYPPYFLAVAASILLYGMFLDTYTIPHWNLAQALTLLPLGQIKYVLSVEWSLTYEIFFYMLCTVWAMGPLRKYYLRLLIVWFLVILVLQYQQESLLLKLHQIPFSKYNYYFILGGFIYYLNKRKKIANQNFALIILGVSAGLYILLFHIRTYLPATPTLILGIAFAGVLYGMLQLSTSPTSALITLGDHSYGLYLTHVPIIVIILTLWADFVGGVNTLAGLLAFGTALTFGWLFGKIEVALHRWIKTQSGLRRFL